MNRKQHMLHTIKRMYQKGINKYLLGIVWFCSGCFGLFGFAFLITASSIFAWLMYGAMSMEMVVGVIGLIWSIRDAVKQIKGDQ
jgi:hypothetical protein